MQGNLPSLAQAGQGMGGMGQAPSFMQDEQQPTHVVGSQGRRGILPSAPGRPNPPAQGTGTTAKSMIPQKDADGKYPCPHCNKTYLHAKHLKRHLLRRTYFISHAFSRSNAAQILVIVHTCVTCARTRSPAQTSSSVISRNARCDEETRQVLITWLISEIARTLGTGCLSATKKDQLV